MELGRQGADGEPGEGPHREGERRSDEAAKRRSAMGRGEMVGDGSEGLGGSSLLLEGWIPPFKMEAAFCGFTFEQSPKKVPSKTRTPPSQIALSPTREKPRQ